MSERMPIVAGNWKMNLGPTEARDFAASLLSDLVTVRGVEIVLCPPAISLPAVSAVLSGTNIKLGAQNMFYEEKGAFTGEISPTMIEGLCDYVILGHSERRTYFGETDDIVNRKALAAFEHNIRPIVCVGEHLEDRDANRTERVITSQVYGSLKGFPAHRLNELVVAYEPIWAIGTGRAATPQDAADVAALIRALLVELYGAVEAATIRVQYGGSVTTANAGSFAAIEDIDGSLVGGASLKPDFAEIARQTLKAKGARGAR
ncbi:MAG TPA: triose-phosphate isomerase [Ktedonobacterales bacterium]|nr:triose-phosphate isomerase [Ktedonobacterales bacterium]